jgi:hypothetical protein
MDEQRKMAKVVNRRLSGEKQSDAQYWRSQSPAARIAALEEIRRVYNEWKYGIQPGLQRVVHRIPLGSDQQSKESTGMYQDPAERTTS